MDLPIDPATQRIILKIVGFDDLRAIGREPEKKRNRKLQPNLPVDKTTEPIVSSIPAKKMLD